MKDLIMRSNLHQYFSMTARLILENVHRAGVESYQTLEQFEDDLMNVKSVLCHILTIYNPGPELEAFFESYHQNKTQLYDRKALSATLATVVNLLDYIDKYRLLIATKGEE